MSTDHFQGKYHTQEGPIIGGFDVTPHDTNELTTMVRAIMVSTAGDVAVTMRDGTNLTLPGLLVGVIYPIRAKIIEATATSATGIKGLY